MYQVIITWSEGEPTVMKCDSYEKALQWAAYYNSKANDPDVQGLVAVSIKG